MRQEHADGVHTPLGLPLQLLWSHPLNGFAENAGLIFELSVEAGGLGGPKTFRRPE